MRSELYSVQRELRYQHVKPLILPSQSWLQIDRQDQDTDIKNLVSGSHQDKRHEKQKMHYLSDSSKVVKGVFTQEDSQH